MTANAEAAPEGAAAIPPTTKKDEINMNSTPVSEPRYSIATSLGTGPALLHWEQQAITWPKFIERLEDRTGLRATKADAGGYVAGMLQQVGSKSCDNATCPQRHKNNRALVSRSMVTLDVDTPGPSFLDDVKATGWSAVTHPSSSSTPDAPRYRLVIRSASRIEADDYEAVAEWCAHRIGSDHFDPSTYQRVRTMYWPTVPKGGRDHYEVTVFDGDPLDVGEAVLMADLEGFGSAPQKEQAEYWFDPAHPPSAEEQMTALRILKWSAESVENAGDGVRNDTLLRRSVRLWRFVLGGCLEPDEVEQAMRDAYAASGVDRDDFEHTFAQAQGYADDTGPDRPTGDTVEAVFDVVEAVPAASEPLPPVATGVVGKVLEKRPAAPVVRLPSKSEVDIAEFLLERLWTKEGCFELRTWAGATYEHHETHWEVMPSMILNTTIEHELDNAIYKPAPTKGTPNPDWVPWKATSRALSEIERRIENATRLHPAVGPGSWLECNTGACPVGEHGRRYLSFSNGILDLDTLELFAHNRAFFNTYSLHFAYDPEAACPEWVDFLESVFKDDPKSADTLEEVMAYLILGGPNFDKMFALLGLPRAGKGTVMRLLGRMLGSGYSTQDLDDLADRFGLEDLLGVLVCHFAEASSTRDARKVTKIVKTITGRDGSRTVKRKGSKSEHKVDIAAKFVFTGNTDLGLQDDSGVIAERFIGIWFGQSFLHHEDHELEDRLTGELSGIFNRMLVAHARLLKRGRFEQPASGERIIDAIRQQASPDKAWFASTFRKCTPAEGYVALDGVVDLYLDAPHVKAETTRRSAEMSVNRILGNEGLKSERVGSIENGDRRVRVFPGLRLKTAEDG